MKSMVLRLLREPLVHFLLLGLLLFVLYAALGGSGSGRSIRVDDKVGAGLIAKFEATWQRPPTQGELNALIDSHVRDEIFYREGLALGLDRDDPTIKRRVGQKFQLLAEESEAAFPPTDAELDAWLKAHKGRYAEPPLVTFEQILIDPGPFGGSVATAVKAARKALAAGSDPAGLGAGRMLPPRFDLFPLDLVERDLGPDFARALPKLRLGQWEGPIRSGFGFHLVRVEKLIPGRTPPLDQVRKAVARDFEADRRSRAADAAYRRLRGEYRVELTAKLPAIRSQ